MAGCNLLGTVFYFVGYFINALRWGSSSLLAEKSGQKYQKITTKKAKEENKGENDEENVRRRKKPRKYY